MNKRNLAVMASCMLLYTSFAYAVNAEETQNSDSVAADKNSQSGTRLDEVVVTDTMLNQLKVPIKMTVITEEQIKAKGAQTVAEALDDVAGLTVNKNSVKGKGYGQIRGSDASSTKVIIDGVECTSVGDGRTDLSLISTDNIEKIEIFKGTAPVVYGTNAPGGVIFITTKNATGKTSGALTIARGSWDTETYALSLSGKADQVSYYFGGKTTNTDGFDDNPHNIGGYAKHAAERSEYFNGKLKWDINAKSSLTVFGSYTDATKELPNRYGLYNGTYQRLGYPSQGGAFTQSNRYFGGGSRPGFTYNWEYDPYRQAYISAAYNLKMNKDNELSLKAFHYTQESFLKTSGAQFIDWDGGVNGWELQHTIRMSKKNVATWGYAYETRDLTERTPAVSITGGGTSEVATPLGFDVVGKYDYTGKSFYIQDVVEFNPKLAASFGYRHNSNTDDESIIFTDETVNGGNSLRPDQHAKYTSDDPVFTMNYKLSGATTLHGSIGKSFRSPNAMERSSPAFDTVLPEEGINRELGLSTSKSGLNFGFTYFSRDITNMIKGGGGGGPIDVWGNGGSTSYYNIPDVDMHGYEIEVSKKFNKRLKGFLNYSYTNAFDTRVGMQVSDTPYRKYSYGFNYAGKGGVSANLAVNYVGDRRSLFSQGNGNGEMDGNTGVDYTGGSGNNGWKTSFLPGYHVVDLKINKAAENKEYYIKILNLFDKEYYSGSYQVAPGRYVEVGTTIKF